MFLRFLIFCEFHSHFCYAFGAADRYSLSYILLQIVELLIFARFYKLFEIRCLLLSCSVSCILMCQFISISSFVTSIVTPNAFLQYTNIYDFC